jgi:hypothetical protein
MILLKDYKRPVALVPPRQPIPVAPHPTNNCSKCTPNPSVAPR